MDAQLFRLRQEEPETYSPETLARLDGCELAGRLAAAQARMAEAVQTQMDALADVEDLDRRRVAALRRHNDQIHLWWLAKHEADSIRQAMGPAGAFVVEGD